MTEKYGVDDEKLTVDYGCPFYIQRDPFIASEYGYPPREVNQLTYDGMPVHVQMHYRWVPKMRGSETGSFVRREKPPQKWVKQENGRWMSVVA